MFFKSRTEPPKPISLVKFSSRARALMTGAGTSVPSKDHVPLLRDQPTLEQRLHLIAVRIDGRPLVVLSGKLASVDRPVAASPR